MCGIAGVFRFDRPDLAGEDVAALLGMGAIQSHRGPDDSGCENLGACGLVSQRLAILDLSPQGHMPMWSDDRSLMLVYNGEVYNYVELRDELRALGHTFRSDGDTEVILRAYQQWGEGCVERFVGMWAFALYDHSRRALLLSRDRVGVKPLYVHQTRDRLVFASEIKAIVSYLRERGETVAMNESSVATYAAVGMVDGLEQTFFRGVRRFPAANNWIVAEDGVRERQYWSLPDAANNTRKTMEGRSDDEVFRELEKRLNEAVRVHLRSDVPVGVCLSGGLDSSAVVGLASRHVPKVKTFTVYFPDGPEYDEREHSRRIVQRFAADSTEKRVTPTDLLAEMKQLVWQLDEPTAALGVYPQWHVMELAHHQVKVVLDGQGGDEAFGGYINYLPQHLYSLLPERPISFLGEVIGAGRVMGWARARADARSALAMSARKPMQPSIATTPDAELLDPDLRQLADVSWNEWRLWPRIFDDWLNNVLYWELTKMRLPALLRYEDRLSMAYSIESRVPLLDHRVLELAFAIPGRLKFNAGWSKYALRKSMEHLLPPEVTWRRDKKGFPTPVGRWLKDERGEAVRDLLRSSSRRTSHLFPSERLEPSIRAHESGAADRSWQLWRAMSVEVWSEAYGL